MGHLVNLRIGLPIICAQLLMFMELFASSYGKGLIDEISSALKNAVYDTVTSQRVVVTDDGYRHISFLGYSYE